LGEKLVMLGLTVKLIPLLSHVLKFEPWYLTATMPVAAQVGTGTTRTVSLVLVGVAKHSLPSQSRKATIPLGPNFSARLKPVPVMVTEFPMTPEMGDRLAIIGDAL
jgi:hypothetical protein